MNVTPGAVKEFVFEAYASGHFPVTVHRSTERPPDCGHHEDTLLYLEVHPR